MTPWLHVVGIGADGMAGLAPAARAVVEAAEVIVGGDRHHRLSEAVTAQRLAWPHPFDALIDTLTGLRGRRVVVLATGDPLWFSVGARIARALPPGDIVFHPHVGAFQLAAARMGWSLADVETLTVHGRPVEQAIPWLQPGARLLILTTGAETPGRIAAFLRDLGMPRSVLTLLADMGGPEEAVMRGTAKDWDGPMPDFTTLAVHCVADDDATLRPRSPGLPDDAFTHDGTMTKREVRALTLARLMPMRGQMLWDVGCGCGSVAVEWMRAAPDTRAVGVEPRADRRALAARNAIALGTPALRLIDGTAPAALADLPPPDAVFLGGGLSADTIEVALAALRPLGRLVANAVTLEGEGLLGQAQARHGGDLTCIAIARAAPLGPGRGWVPLRPVTQWALVT